MFAALRLSDRDAVQLKRILLIHGSAQMGGVETLLLRLARELSLRGVEVRVLLLSRASDPGLLLELTQFAMVSYLDRLLDAPFNSSDRLALISALLRPNRAETSALLDGVDHVHFTESITMTLCTNIISFAKEPVRVSGGVYYQYEYAYPDRSRRYCTTVMEQQFAHHATEGRMLFFSEMARERLGSRLGLDLRSCPVLPIGIDLKRARLRRSELAKRTKVVSVGRVTDFKTYNIQFLNAVAEMRRRGLALEYHIYGDGPAVAKVRRRIDELGLSQHVNLHGQIEYARFPDVVADAGLFVGSGTALIEAAACGVPALIGIETQPNDQSYGFLHEMDSIAYHEPGILHPTRSFADHVERVLSLDSEAYRALCEASVRKAQAYSIERLVDGWMALDARIAGTTGGSQAPGFSPSRFVCSLAFDKLAATFGGSSNFWSRYDQ